jgi:hypothetical protein
MQFGQLKRTGVDWDWMDQIIYQGMLVNFLGKSINPVTAGRSRFIWTLQTDI